MQPSIRYVKVGHAPKKAPCPHCGKKGRRKQAFQRQVRSLGYHCVVILIVTYAEYRSRCSCCKTFRTCPEEIEPKCQYDNKVRQAVLDRILQDGMNVQSTREAMKRDFFLELSEGFVYDCLHWKAAQLDMAEYRRWTLQRFSGTLCVDELHLGRYTLLLATDPLHDFPVAFALVASNDGQHMRRFLSNLKTWGFEPQVIVTDGSSLYPEILAELWPQADHQLCVFHVLQDINQKILDALKRLRRKLANRGKAGRKRRRGRPSKAQSRARRRAQKRLKEQASFIFKRRHLIVKRRENMSEQEQKDLQQMLEYLPELRVLREFADRVSRLFDPNQTERQARCRRAALLRDKTFAQVPELVQAMKMLSTKKFTKMIAFLRSPLGRRVRTNNHVERTNRRLRYLEKVRYKWRRRRTIVRFVTLAFARWREHAAVSTARVPDIGAPCDSRSLHKAA